MAEKETKKKEINQVRLPKAMQSVKHRNETAQARTTYEDTYKVIGTIMLIGLVLFVLLGGVSQTGVLKFCLNWSHNIGSSISNWLEGGSVVTNEDGVYWDPTGQEGDKIGNDEANTEVPDMSEELFEESNDQPIENAPETETRNNEVQTE